MRMPWRHLLDKHPPWAHWSFFIVWALTASVGPIWFVVGLVSGSGRWWIGLVIYGMALVTMGVDWLVVRRLRRHTPNWKPWEPPKWVAKSSA